jgi:long-chain acyl-CoA synthetase
MLLQEFLENSAQRFPDKTALVCGSDRFTYAELDAMANRLAHALRSGGVSYRDRVVVMLDNSLEAVVSIFGILKGDACFVLVNPTMKQEKLSFILNNCSASAFITHEDKWDTASPAIHGTPSLKCVFLAGHAGRVPPSTNLMHWSSVLDRFPATQPPRVSIDIDLAALIYTSGSTGDPKGVMLTHQNMVSASTSITTYLENTDTDVLLNTLPLSFDYGLYQVIMSAQFGGTVVLEKSFLYPYVVINLLKQERVTGFPLVPTISAILLQMETLPKERFEHLRYITNTAAALPVSHIRGLQTAFPGVRIYSMYGLTECKRVSYLPPEELDRRPTSVGKGMPNEQVYLIDEAGNIITESNVVGELVVRGANVMRGYWENPEETALMLRPGPYHWEKVLHTGDLFKMDEEEFLYFVSRKDSIIKSRGEKVSPREVESMLYELPDVVEAAVVGVPDELLGEAIKAFVVLKEGSKLTDRDIETHCRKHLEDFMVPKYVEFRKSLPKTSSGKITVKGL